MNCEFLQVSTGRVRCKHCGREVPTTNAPDKVVAKCRAAGDRPTTATPAKKSPAPCSSCNKPAPPSIGVVIPTYNCGEYLERCVESFRAQTVKPSRVVIVDDGSTDDTAAVLLRLGLTLPAATSPGILSRGMNYAAALLRRLPGVKSHGDDVTDARLQICDRCPSHDPDKKECRECGCPVAVKAAWPTETCPRGFWDDGFPVEVITLPTNQGANAARQIGLETLTAEWVVIADADAEYAPDYLEKLHAAAKRDPAADLVYCSWERVRPDRVERITAKPWDPRALWVGNFVSMCSLVRRSALPVLVPSPPHLEGLDDWQIWLQFAADQRKGVAVPDVLFKAWERPEGKTGALRNDQSGLKRKIAYHRRRFAALIGCTDPVSIVIPFFNCGDLLTRCLEHIRDFCGVPYEIVIVDNGSTDPVPVVAGVDPLVIRNTTNRGFTVACNQGLRASPGRHVLLLNSDCFIGPDCVERLVGHLAPGVAAVGPRTGDGGCASLPGRMSAMEGARATHARRTPQPVSMVAFFCTLLNRDAVKALGPLDTRPVFESGLGADDEWCIRARRAGWNVLRADDAYAEHVGRQSFVRNGVDRDALQVPAIKEVKAL